MNLDEGLNEFFSYPFDNNKLFRNRNHIRDVLKKKSKQKIKIALLSGSTIGELKDYIELFLLKNGIECEFWEGAYNSFFEEVHYSDDMWSFSPDFVYIHTTHKNILNWPKSSDNEENVFDTFGLEFSRWKSLINVFTKRNIKLIINNFDYPLYRHLGNLDGVLHTGKVNFIRKLNSELAKNLASNVFLNDINYLSSVFGLDKWHNISYWYSFKYAVSPQALPLLASSVSSIITSSQAGAKKVLVCDLDNTMWGGIIGDDGLDGIKIGPDSPKGAMFSDTQSYVKSLSERGVILSVNSKNNHDIAKSGFTHEHSIISFSDFSSFQASWEMKSSNMKKIEQELNVFSDSFVFIDDNSREIFQINQSIPDIDTITYEKSPIEFLVNIDRLGYFEPIKITEDDLKRNEYYKQNAKRKQAQDEVSSPEEYLASLEMQARIYTISSDSFERVLQLINKTNQFNTTTRRLTNDTLTMKMDSLDNVVICSELDDKFGKNGIVSALIADINGGVANISSWVMSCRVFNRKLEYAIFDYFIDMMKERNIQTITAEFIPTAKNGYIDKLYNRLGFSIIENNNESVTYRLELKEEYLNKNHYIGVNKHE